MFSYDIQGNKENPLIKLKGNLILEHALKIYDLIKSQLELSKSLTLDLEDAEKLDISFIQILFSLLKSPEVKLSFTPPPLHFIQYANKIGARELLEKIKAKTKEKTDE